VESPNKQLPVYPDNNQQLLCFKTVIYFNGLNVKPGRNTKIYYGQIFIKQSHSLLVCLLKFYLGTRTSAFVFGFYL